MTPVRILKELNDRIYFFTLSVKGMEYALDRYARWYIIANSLSWFQRNRKLKIFSFVFMINHIHLLVRSDDAIGFIRDFKKYTDAKLLQNIKQYELSLLEHFKNKSGGFSFWNKNNWPELIETEKFFIQKQNYIQNNPVKRTYVLNAEGWYWSSANKFCELRIDDIYEE